MRVVLFKMMDVVLNNDGYCSKMDGVCIQNDGFCAFRSVGWDSAGAT